MKNYQRFGGVLLIIILVASFLVTGILGFLGYRYLSPSQRKLRAYTKGFMAYKYAKYAVAVKEFSVALEIDAKDLNIRYLLASSHFLYAEQDKDQAEYEKAIAELHKMLSIDSEYAQAHTLLIDIYSRLAFIVMGYSNEQNTLSDEQKNKRKKLQQEYFQKAIEHCDRLVSLYPKDVEYLNKRGLTFYQMEYLDKAKEDFFKAISINPKNEKAYLNLAMLYWENRQSEEACTTLENYLKEQNAQSLDAHVELAEYYIELRKFSLALEHFQIADGIKPDSYDKVLPGLSLALFNSGEIDKAILMAERGLAKITTEKEERYARPKIIMTYVLGACQLAKRDFESAAKNLLWVFDKAPLFADVTFKLAAAYQFGGKTGLAIEKLKEGIKNLPSAMSLRTMLIEILSQEGSWEDAEKECNNALDIVYKIMQKVEESKELSPKNRELFDKENNQFILTLLRLKARIFLAQGKYENANTIYQEISKLSPASGEGQLGLAVVQISQNKFADALVILKKVVTENPNDPVIHFLTAQAHAGMNNLEQSLEEINTTLKLDGNFISARVLLARIRMFQNAVHLATQEYEALYKAYPDDIRILMELGQLYMRQNLFDKALELFQKAPKINLNDDMFLEVFARIYFAKKEYDKSFEYLNKIKNHTPEQKTLQGDLYYATGKYDEAIEAFQRASLVSDKVQLYVPMAVSFYMKKMWKEAIENLRLQLDITPKADLFRLFRAMLLVFEKNYEEAIEESKYVVREDNQLRWLGRVIRAGMFIDMQQWEQAEDELKDIPETFPYLQDLQGIINICQNDSSCNLHTFMETLILQELSRQEEALAKCEEALRMFPNQPVMQFVKANILLRLEDLDKSCILLESLIELPNAPLYMYNTLAELYIRTQQYDQAEKCYFKALRKNPNSKETIIALAMLYENQKKLPKAIQQYQKILQMADGNKKENAPIRTIALNNLAWLYLESQDAKSRKQALQYAIESFEASQYSWAIADTLGWAYYYNNDLQQAMRYLNYAKNLKPDYPSIYYHLAKVYQKMNKIDEAREALKQALVISKDFKEAKECENLLKTLETEK